MEKEVKNSLKKLKLNESTISTILGALVVIVVGVLVFNYFSKRAKEVEIKPEEITLEEAEMKAEEERELPTKHKVKSGEHLWVIATDYYNDGYKWPEIAKANNLANPNLISPDQELTIPKIEVTKEEAKEVRPEMEPITGEKYTVEKGDCLWFIALRTYGDPYKWSEIAQANKLGNPDLIHPGNVLVIPK